MPSSCEDQTPANWREAEVAQLKRVRARRIQEAAAALKESPWGAAPKQDRRRNGKLSGASLIVLFRVRTRDELHCAGVAHLRLSRCFVGLQKSVLTLYRDFLRAASTKSPEGRHSIHLAVRAGFEVVYTTATNYCEVF